jgi:predicted O-methyltransferase YrrM
MSLKPVDQRGALQQVRDVIERLARDGTIVARSDGRVRQLAPVAITAQEGEALRDWVRREGATHTIEIGLGHGLSALFICEALLEGGNPDARHAVLDPNQQTWYADSGLQALADAGLLQMVDHHAEESQITLPRFISEGRVFDFAFVDGNHRFDRVFLDLIYLGRLVRRGGIIMVDDYQLPSIRRAASFCLTNLDWTLEEASAEDEVHQWAVLRTTQHDDTRTYDHFLDF